MNCEKCGNNEATFHYRSIINGEKQEYHFCSDCAKEESSSETLEYAFQPEYTAYNSFWGNPFAMMNSFFGDSRFASLMGQGRSAPATLPLWYNIFIGDGKPSTKGEEKSADNIPDAPRHASEAKREWLAEAMHPLRHHLSGDSCIPEDAGSEIRAKRELCALKSQLETAVKAEEFEKAAQLRDKIREMEK